MNGLLLLVIYSLVSQVGGAGGGAFPPQPLGIPSNLPIPAIIPQNPTQLTSPPLGVSSVYQIGWKTDDDGKFAMIMQIAPDAIAEFARGSRGQEIPADIPPEIQARIQKIILRVGTNEVERIPATLPPLVNNRNGNGNAHLATLNNNAPIDSRTPISVNIDPQRSEVLPTAGQGNMSNAIGGSNGGFGVQDSVLPNSPTNNPNSQEVMPGGPSGSLSVAQRDGFSSPRGLDFLKNSQGSSVLPNLPYQNPNSALPNTNSNTYNNTPSTYANTYNPAFNTRTNPTYTASNPNGAGATPNFQSQSTIPPPLPTSYPTGNLTQPIQNAPPQYQPPSNYAANNNPFAATNPINNYAARQNGAQLPTYETEDPAQSSNKLLPFLLLFSIVGNVYLGLWMSHLRTRYRQLLSNMRGIPVSDLDN